MITQVVNLLKSMPAHRRRTAFAVIIAGILFPWILIVPLSFTHDFMSAILDFGPLRYLVTGLLCLSVLLLVVAIADLVIKARRRSIRKQFPSVLIWILSAISIFFVVDFSAYIAPPQIIRTGNTPPQLLMTEGESGIPGIAVVFWTQAETANKLEWGLAGGIRQTLQEPKPSHCHWFQLQGIASDNLYEYSLNGETATKFKTPPMVAGPLHFAASGDPHFGSYRGNNVATAKMLDVIKDPANDYSMLFILGDCPNLGFIDSLWKQSINAIAACSSYIPTNYVIGNHDTLFGGMNLYQDYLLPESNSKGSAALWKRIDCGNVHFLILDLEWDLRLYTPEQKSWLITQLEYIPRDDWCIVMSHTFYYCSGGYIDGWRWYDNPDTIAKLTPLFEKYDVDLVLSGHKHHSELLQHNGVTYAVIGSFGGPPSPEREYISPASVWYKQGAYAFVDVTIDNYIATLVFRDPDNDELYKIAVEGR